MSSSRRVVGSRLSRGGPEDEIELSASEEEELLESIREAERGEVVTADDLLRRLAR